MDVERGGARRVRAPSPAFSTPHNRSHASRVIGYALIVCSSFALTRPNCSSARPFEHARVVVPLDTLGEHHHALFEPVLSGLLRDIDGGAVKLRKSRLTLVTNVASK